MFTISVPLDSSCQVLSNETQVEVTVEVATYKPFRALGLIIFKNEICVKLTKILSESNN